MKNRIGLFISLGFIAAFAGSGCDDSGQTGSFNLALGEACVAPNQCASGACDKGVCVPGLNCSNGMQDKDKGESDVDCGGLTCAKCVDGKMCITIDDCKSGKCVLGMGGSICAASSVDASAAMDMSISPDQASPLDQSVVQDQAMTVDQAMASDQSIASDQAAVVDQAAASDQSVPNDLVVLSDLSILPDQSVPSDQSAPRDLTVPPDLAPICVVNNMKDGSETGIDCGGGCAPCVVGQTCGQNSDCKSGACNVNACVAAYTTGIVDMNKFPAVCPMGSAIGFQGWDNAGNPIVNGPPLVVKPGLGWGPHVMISVTCNGVLIGAGALKPFCGKTLDTLGIRMTRNDGEDISNSAIVSIDPFSAGYKIIAYAKGAPNSPANPACP